MNKPEYVSTQEVQRVCQELGLRDWTQLGETRISLEEAKLIQQAVGGVAEQISSVDFQQGLQIELEHGAQFPDANVTNNHPLLTGMIVLAHLKEMLDYYTRLAVAEIEGDLLKAFRANNPEKMIQKYSLLLQARAELIAKEIEKS